MTDPDAFADTTALPIIERVDTGHLIDGRYEVREHIGSGGFAAVFDGYQPRLERPVAIKVLNLSLAASDDPTFEKRFLREARTAARLAHPNVVAIFDYGVTGDLRQPYIIMERLVGQDLETRLREHGPLTPDLALPLIQGALDALAVAHEHGVVHKDLKPANLFLARMPEGRQVLKVLDFGVARLTGPDGTRFTASGDFIGTPAYAAPEYVESLDVTPAVDVYQMGLILAEALTGKPLVDDDNPVACIRRHAEGRVEIPTALAATPLGPVLRCALATDPTARFADAACMRDALRGLDPAAIAAALDAQPLERNAEDTTRDSQPVLARIALARARNAERALAPDPPATVRRQRRLQPDAPAADPARAVETPRRRVDDRRTTIAAAIVAAVAVAVAVALALALLM